MWENGNIYILHLFLGKPTAAGRPCYKLASDGYLNIKHLTVRQHKLGKVSGNVWLLESLL